MAFVAIFLKISRYALILYTFYGLGLIFDEFGIWIKLDPNYNQLISLVVSGLVATALSIVIITEFRFPGRFDEYEGKTVNNSKNYN